MYSLQQHEKNYENEITTDLYRKLSVLVVWDVQATPLD